MAEAQTIDPNDLSCQEFVELVTDYLEGALAAPDRARFEAHLLDCDECTIYLDQFRLTIRALGSLPRDGLSEPAKATLLDRFRDWKRG